MSLLVRHPYHLVEESPWPLLGAMGSLLLTSGMVKWFQTNQTGLFFSGLFLLLMVVTQWWRDVSLESATMGLHTKLVELGLRWGMVLFIVSEVLFFFSFFWAFYHSSLSPAVDLGGIWPPAGIKPFNPLQVPLLNTLVLLSSGVSLTWAHHSMMEDHYLSAKVGLIWTTGLGVYFTFLQGLEYMESSYSIADSVYGATFFVATGFHGLHVLIGTAFLAICLARHTMGHYTFSHHFGFEAAAWYWHFVDVVWLFLFVSIYWWGGN